MANFGICRVIKHSTRGSVTASANHNFRAVDTPNADPGRLHLNEHAGAVSVGALNAAIDDRFASLIKKPRKNSVVALEYFVGLSPDAEIFKDKARLDKYFDDAIGCIVNRHGVENVLVASRHNDEKTPHLCIIVTPIDPDGHLNARHFTGGFLKMRAIQNEHYKAASEPAGLERGQIGSKATHQQVSAFYSTLKSESEYLNDSAALVSKKLALSHDVAEFDAKVVLFNEAKKRLRLADTEVLRSVPLALVFSEIGAGRTSCSDSDWMLNERRFIVKEDKKSWTSEDKKGSGAIDLVMHVAQCSYAEALIYLRKKFSNEFVMNEALERTRDNVKKIMQRDQSAVIEIGVSTSRKHSKIIRSTSDDLISNPGRLN